MLNNYYFQINEPYVVSTQPPASTNYALFE
jgi:hypothetical protein